MTHKAFLKAFESATLARSGWNHDAHVRMAWLYLGRFRFDVALAKAKAGIRKLNEAFAAAHVGQCRPAEKTPGYHDTLTVAFFRLIAARLEVGEGFPDFRERNPDLFDRSLSVVRKHYTKKLLFSAAARAEFVEPNRTPLPPAPGSAEPGRVAPHTGKAVQRRTLAVTSA